MIEVSVTSEESLPAVDELEELSYVRKAWLKGIGALPPSQWDEEVNKEEIQG